MRVNIISIAAGPLLYELGDLGQRVIYEQGVAMQLYVSWKGGILSHLPHPQFFNLQLTL
jgi:hypothetical protein